MPVPEALRRLSLDPGFWTGGISDADCLPELLRVSFPVLDGYALVLEIELPSGERTLGLRRPASSEPVQLGRAPALGPFPAALRWWELETCARVIALADPTLPHPGLVVALLSPFAPATADDDVPAVAGVREAAYRSLRREVPPPPPSGPEQAPLPLFADDRWWPAPPAPSPQVLDEAAIATLSDPAQAVDQVRAGKRFPHEELADLVRRATAHLEAVPHREWYAGTRPLARRIADSGDLGPVPDLLGALTEAGCDHPTVLDALSEPLVPLEACWMVETLAGAEPGTLLRHHV
ncbi:hypothetical protein [Actinoplanes teichomyceticus]|uniref:Uncharacterized protein n=1 Tax=Actinoplanes teichomyceticus TaxID=1867 RepID=A0A561WRD5_ACTTI|nr:hypothetical protein [Actinoplanes teichomyceticus]TWG26431.1 hypothetical protein FHX34_1011415 [Actinoplanes teichomyceticus]GIF11507.1 hypothetical protein Ate01nite_15390 [Actinoplanes teichomyceticus]